MGLVEEGRVRVGGVEAFYRRVPGDGTPVVYCHGNPTHGEEWVPLMERGGPAIAIDMPGWGRSSRPDPARFDYSMYGLSAFLERCLDELGVGRRKLVVHDWGSLALIGAQRRPELVEKLVVVNAVPLLPGYRWHWVAQLWRRRPLGEIVNATATKASMSLTLRQARGDRSAMPPEFIDLIWDHLDKGTHDATLALYRHADPARLAQAGKSLGSLTCPALVLWGARDPYLPTKFGQAYAESLPNAELELLSNAGHWPLLDQPQAKDRILKFVA
ncbi:MAG TPA: alpha/beta hydrolase [Solirubrobacterales bacterium]|jgi:pimeloyl-ACP methyl ester carboxylesterase|nr:alpha/beta hydrolase [Solirubrobacterales bacterium]